MGAGRVSDRTRRRGVLWLTGACRLPSVDRLLNPAGRAHMALEEQLRELLDKLDLTCSMKSSGSRSKRAKLLKKEIALVRNKLSQQHSQPPPSESGTGGLEEEGAPPGPEAGQEGKHSAVSCGSPRGRAPATAPRPTRRSAPSRPHGVQRRGHRGGFSFSAGPGKTIKKAWSELTRPPEGSKGGGGRVREGCCAVPSRPAPVASARGRQCGRQSLGGGQRC